MMNITLPIVTVYITNYNYEKYIKKAIESVLNQTFHDFELIIIDDGSTDGSRKIIRPYENNAKVRIIFQENKGLNRTSNIALKAARGEYIMRLDADDFLDPNALLVMTNIMKSNPDLGMVFPDYYYVDENDWIIGQERRHDFQNSVKLLDQPANGACTLIRKCSLIGLGGYCEDYRCQDGYDLWLQFIEKHEVRNVNLPLFYYRRHGNNLTENNELILTTRATIKEAHAEKSKKPHINAIAILPVRGRKIDAGCLALEPLGDKLLIDWTIEAALNAKNVKSLIVTTPDDDILSHITKKYRDKVKTHTRSIELARENIALDDSIKEVLEKFHYDFEIQCLALLTIEAPFRSAMYIDKAVNTMRIFDVEIVIGVIPENNLFFQHNGQGMQIIGTSNLNSIRYERDYIYRKLCGMHLLSAGYYNNEKSGFDGKIGHVVFDPGASVTVRNRVDLDIANFILRKKKTKALSEQ